MATPELWTYANTTWRGEDLVGYDVESIDGSIGSVDDATYEVEGSYLVIDTGPWIFGKKVVLPAGIVERIDASERKVFVARTKDQIKNAPEYDESRFGDVAYRAELGRYYGPGGAGSPRATSVRAGRGSA